MQVAAELDGNRIESRSETFDPESRVVRSTQTRTESAADQRARRDGERRQRAARRQPATAGPIRTRAARHVEQERGNRQLRDFALHPHRGDRRRAPQAPVGRRAGRRHLRQGRQRRGDLPAAAAGGARAHRRRWCAPPSASTSERGDQLEVVNLRFAETPPRAVERRAAGPDAARCSAFTRTTSCASLELARARAPDPDRLLHRGAAARQARAVARSERRRASRPLCAAG